MRPSIALFSRSAWKGPYITAFPSLQEALKNNTPIYTKARACTIVPNFVGLRFMIYNGKEYHPITVSEDMVGHKLGEFSVTRKRYTYRQTKNK